jgi:hypothetical protein
MQRIASASDIGPTALSDVFHAADDPSGHPRFELGPLVFSVPEKPTGRAANIYIVVQGWIIFAPPQGNDERGTTFEFGTEVGYFRLKDEHLVHVYGAHYDMDEKRTGHPVFHGQISSQAKLATVINDEFHLSFESDNDRVASLLRNVRTPSAL